MSTRFLSSELPQSRDSVVDIEDSKSRDWVCVGNESCTHADL